MDLIFVILILLFLLMYSSEKPKCGIPIFQWCVVYFVIMGLKSVSNLVRIAVIRYAHRQAAFYSISSFIIMDGAYLGWLIYGNIIFYSEENNCRSVESTSSLYVLMLFLLIIGYF